MASAISHHTRSSAAARGRGRGRAPATAWAGATPQLGRRYIVMRKGQGRHDATEVAPELEGRLCRHGWAASVAVVARIVVAVREPTTARLAMKVLLDVGPILDSFEPRANFSINLGIFIDELDHIFIEKLQRLLILMAA
uniref:Uncharacterized protein n=1 Tax=Oryza barthii TaxID=65489 RepID=A0A0D3GYJ6_9ORYZ